MVFSKEGTWSFSKEGTWSFSKEENPGSLQLELTEHITLQGNGEPLLGRAPHNLYLLYTNYSISILEW